MPEHTEITVRGIRRAGMPLPGSRLATIQAGLAAVVALGGGWAAPSARATTAVPAPEPIVTRLGSTPIAQLSGGGGGLPDLGATVPYQAGSLVKVLIDYHDSGRYERGLDQIDEFAERIVLRAVRDRKVAALRRDSRARARARAEHSAKQWWRKKQAIVFDIDETTLSNWSAMHADGFTFGPQSQAGAVNKVGVAIEPTLELYKVARSHRVHVFYVTGRPESLRRPTAENLAREGFGHYAGLVLKPSGSTATTVAYKSGARAAIESRGYRIIASVGDQFSDLAGGHEDWGFKLPNPFYYLP